MGAEDAAAGSTSATEGDVSPAGTSSSEGTGETFSSGVSMSPYEEQ